MNNYIEYIVIAVILVIILLAILDRFTGLYIKSKDFLKKINSLNKE